MYALEPYVEAPSTLEALRFIVQQYLRMRDTSRSDNSPIAPQQQNQSLAAPPPAPNMPQPPQQPMAYRQQPQPACFNFGDTSNFVADCPLKDRARIPLQQQVNSCHTNPSGGWT